MKPALQPRLACAANILFWMEAVWANPIAKRTRVIAANHAQNVLYQRSEARIAVPTTARRGADCHCIYCFTLSASGTGAIKTTSQYETKRPTTPLANSSAGPSTPPAEEACTVWSGDTA